MNILVLEKRGCDFFGNDEEIIRESDVGNYRVYSHCLAKNGTSHHVEFNRVNCCERKGNKIVAVHHHALGIETQYDTEKHSFRNSEIEKAVYNNNNIKYTYTKKDILEVVNKYFDNKIEQIRIYENIYNEIEKIATETEKSILN